MKIKKALKSDWRTLTELTIQSKSYWNYSKQQLLEWKDDLTVSEAYIHKKEVYTVMSNNSIIGYYAFFKVNDNDIELENLFVHPKFIRQGIGQLLMDDFFNRIKKRKFERVVLNSDPNAETFYKKLGFKVIGQLETSIKDRFLPIMEIKNHQIPTK